LFLHQNAFHLLGNMVFVASVGAAVEIAAGSGRFSIVYFCGGLFGVVAHWVITRKFEEPPILIGASGAVAACIAYYSVRYIHLRVPIAPKFPVSVAAVTGVWALLQVVGAVVRIGDTGSSISFWAHIGGLVGGLLLSVVFQAPKLAELELSHGVLREMNQRGPAAVLAAAERHIASHPDDVRGLRERVDALAMMGDCEEEGLALVKLLDSVPESEQGDIVTRLSQIGCLKMLPSLRRTLLAERLKVADTPVAKMLLLSVIQSQDDPQRPDALLALVGIEREKDPDAGRHRLDELLAQYPMHPATEVAKARGWLP
jgi:hypothetical protein